MQQAVFADVENQTSFAHPDWEFLQYAFVVAKLRNHLQSDIITVMIQMY